MEKYLALGISEKFFVVRAKLLLAPSRSWNIAL